MNNEQATEAILQEKGLTAPRLKPEDIDAVIVGEKFHVLEPSLHTMCVLSLRNGFTVTGESACVHPANFNKEIGERLAREDARKKIWPLEAYRLQERLFLAGTSGKQPQENLNPVEPEIGGEG